ncbi:MAG: tRNA pseudouridine(54/55) synthase Pus10 [Candidatus ainarchaeum sp.]|nr:tRNA pseudouridine(54/55) synthase Pus10 [Candidatus ainarchaeum sp.]
MLTKFENNDFSVDEFYSEISKKLKGYEFSSFALGVGYPKEIKEETKKKLRVDFQKGLVYKISKELNKKVDYKNKDILIIIDLIGKKIEYVFKPIYVQGRYNKYSRELPQTYRYCFKCRGKGCKLCDGKGKLSETSVEEILREYFLELFAAEELKFHGAGREDVDVLMLGNGRPFVLELAEPRKRSISKKELKDLEKKINLNEKEIQIHKLKFCKEEKVEKIKQADHKKLYLALVECDEKISQKEIKALKGKHYVKQRTPERVSARRSDLIRERVGKIKKVEYVSENEFKVWIKADAGLYIKEFISGDAGRSIPSVSELLGKKCKCKQLDVLKIL